MITVGMNYQVIPGKQEPFEDVFRAVLEQMETIDGHVESHLYRDAFDDTRYVILSEWSDRDAFDGFIRSDAFAKVANWGKEQILAGRPSHQYYDSDGDSA